MTAGSTWSRGCRLPLLVAGTLLGFLIADVSVPGAADVGRAAAASGTQADDAAPIELGRPIEQSITGAAAYTYRLPLAAGEYASLTVVQAGVDVVVRTLDAAGQVAAEFDLETRPIGEEHVGVIGNASESVRIRVVARYPKIAAGRFTIRVDAIRSATDRDRDEFDARLAYTQSIDLENAGKIADAKAQADRALELAQRALGSNDRFVCFLLTRDAELTRGLADTGAAEALFQRAVAANDAVLGGDDPQTAFARSRLGSLYTALGQYARAEALIDDAIAVTERTLGPDHPRIASMLMSKVAPHYFLEDYAYAAAGLQRALAIAEKTLGDDDFTVMAAINNLGDVYVRLQDYDRGQLYTERALAAVERRYGADHLRVANPLLNLGIIARQKGDYPRALELMWRAYAAREKALGSRHADTAATLITIGNVFHAEGQYDQAVDIYNRALEVFESGSPYYDYSLLARDNAARSYAAKGDVAHALEYLSQADRQRETAMQLNLAIGSEREKLLYAEAIAEKTDRVISLHVNQAADNPAAAAEAALVLLQRKGRVLDAMSGSLTALRQRMTTADRAVLDDFKASTEQLATLALSGPGRTPLDEYHQRLAALEARRDQLEGEVAGRSAEFKAQSRPVTLDAVQRTIPAEAALIELAVYHPFNPALPSGDPRIYGPGHYVAYVLRGEGGVRWKDLGPASVIDKAIAGAREALRNPQRTDAATLLRTLDGLVMQPLRPILGDATRLLVSPDGELNLIPFEALLDDRQHYLVERYSISYLTSGRDLLRLQVPRASTGGLLVVADPAFGEPRPERAAPPARSHRTDRGTTGRELSTVYFAPLFGTADEARAIKAIFPAATVLTGSRATKDAIVHAAAPEILHIATHGFFLQDVSQAPAAGASGAVAGDTRAITATAHVSNPLLRAGLAFSGANLTAGAAQEGILTALEASTLNLWGTRLVTLSACDTGVGDVKNQEGVYGLRRAFVLAGAETLVMSLWPVSDFVTREMMTAYYAGLKRGLGRGDALRHAQLAMLARPNRRHPSYWASFIQAGEWRTLDPR